MSEGDPPIVARVAPGVAAFDAAAWDACADPYDPFLAHAFLAALEGSESVGPATGWQPVPIGIEDERGVLGACMPAYLKSHSRGEYVFDHGWAEAFERAGGAYYPKLQIAVPFTPVPGRRLLARDMALAPRLIDAAEALVAREGLSSAHATFVAPEEVRLFERAGWLIRADLQFHWFNQGYADFDAFLATLASRKRKAIRKERAGAQAGLDIVHMSGGDISARDWDDFFAFYMDTGARKWGSPYLSRAFFSLVGESMKERLLLIVARRGGRTIAGALNFIGGDALYGRYWGAIEPVPGLHFELCYYQAIEAAIARGLSRVEAGAQGPHKLARGYQPVPTFSAHFIADPGFRKAVAQFLARERPAVAHEIGALEEMGPYKKG